MIFTYKAVDSAGAQKQGTVEAVNVDVAIASLQKRGLTISDIRTDEAAKGLLNMNLDFFNRISNKDVVVMSKQIATMFEAQVSTLRVFRLLAVENENIALAKVMNEIADDLQAGSSVSAALNKHPKIFSPFYVNMVKSGEETGKMDQAFTFMADYLDRNFAVSSKIKNALIYPAFVGFTFLTVMILMFTMVIPKISGILKDSGQEVPFYTKIVMSISDFMVSYWPMLVIVAVVIVFFFWRFAQTRAGKESIDGFKVTTPYVKGLFRKLYLSRIADNMNTLLTSGVPMIRTLELTRDVVGNKVYEDILNRAVEDVKGGTTVSATLEKNTGNIPNIFVQMVKVGEETGELGKILKTMAGFYRRELETAVDTMVGLIEPAMIVLLAGGVGILLASILVPIYNISGAF